MQRTALPLLMLLACAPALAATPPEATRGELLYENHCQRCHESTLHVRTDHRAKSAAEVHTWVKYWADKEKLGWTNEDIVEVSDFLVRRYYRFPPPAR